jgi:hypothetical protein
MDEVQNEEILENEDYENYPDEKPQIKPKPMEERTDDESQGDEMVYSSEPLTDDEIKENCEKLGIDYESEKEKYYRWRAKL